MVIAEAVDDRRKRLARPASAERILSRVLSLSEDRAQLVSTPALSPVEGERSGGDSSDTSPNLEGRNLKSKGPDASIAYSESRRGSSLRSNPHEQDRTYRSA